MAAVRITTAALAARVDAQETKMDQILALLTAQAGQHSTPAAVAEKVTKATKAKKVTKVAPVVAKDAPAKVAMPEALKAGFAVLRETKDAISPLNKALDWKGANAGVKATDRPIAEIKAALKKVEAEHGKDVAVAAFEAYKVRLAAAKARAAKA